MHPALWGTRVPKLIVLVVLGYVHGYPPESIYAIFWGTQVSNLVVLVVFGYVPGYIPPDTRVFTGRFPPRLYVYPSTAAWGHGQEIAYDKNMRLTFFSGKTLRQLD